jgi:hypothetical protein
MATKVVDYSGTPASNTSLDSVSIEDGWLPSTVNEAVQALMSHLKKMTDGTAAATDTTDSITAGTTQTQAGATAAPSPYNRITVCANTNDGVKLPSAIANLVVTIKNEGANAAKVWPNTSDTVDGGSVDAADTNTLAATTGVRTYLAVDATDWITISDSAAGIGLGTGDSPVFAGLDVNGGELVLDADGDTSLHSDTDDQIDFRIAGADDFQMTANTFTAQSGSTIAAQALTATTISSSAGITITGTTPTLTIGDAGAEDAAIVFDGNAQDFHIGLDDTADSLAVGLGSALGTTDHMVFDATGAITKPLQPGFFAFLSSMSNNQTGDGTRYTIPTNSEIFDNNGDHLNGTFTAPVSGVYSFTAGIGLAGITSDHTMLDAAIADNSYNYYQFDLDAGNVCDVNNNFYLPLAATFYMTAADTATFWVQISNGAKVVDIYGAGYPWTWWSGYLLG